MKQNIIPIDYHCLYSILVKNGNQEKIASILQLEDIHNLSWQDAFKQTQKYHGQNEVKSYEISIISETILGWNYIMDNKFYNVKYALNCCNNLAKIYKEVWAVVIDTHSGMYRFFVVKNGKIIRFFDRDANHFTSEFGEKLDIEIATEEQEKDYFYVSNMMPRILQVDVLKSNPQFFEKKVLVGKRFYKQIEKYKNLYVEVENGPKINTKNISEDDLPF